MKRHWDFWNDNPYLDEIKEHQPIPIHPISSAIAFISEKLIEILGGGSLLRGSPSPPASPPSQTSPNGNGSGEHEVKKKKRKNAEWPGKYKKTTTKHDLIKRKKRKKTGKVSSIQEKQPDDITIKANVSNNSSLLNEENVISREQCEDIKHPHSLPPIVQDSITRKQPEQVGNKNEPQSLILSTGSIGADNRKPTYYNCHYVKQWLKRSFQDSNEVDGDKTAVNTCVANISFGHATESLVAENEHKSLRRSNRKKPKGMSRYNRK